MNPVIRIPLPVFNMHALAGYFTDGPTVAALYGFVSHLEREVGIPFIKFGFIVKHYDSRLTEYVQNFKKNGLVISGRQTGYRYADAEIVLFLMLPEDYCLDPEHFQNIADEVNLSRVQGGLISKILTKEDVTLIPAEFEQEFLNTLALGETALSRLYLSTVPPCDLFGDALLDYYAEALIVDTTVLMCNGYVQVGEMDGARIAEPNFTLAEMVPAYQMKTISMDEAVELVDRFFWQFDAELNRAKPNFFVIN